MPKLKNMEEYNPFLPGKVAGKAGDNPKKFSSELYVYLGVFAVLIIVGISMNFLIFSPIKNMLGIGRDQKTRFFPFLIDNYQGPYFSPSIFLIFSVLFFP
jgi:hypothetical protein